MSRDENVVMINTFESKIDTIMRAIEDLTMKTNNIQNIISRLNSNQRIGAPQSAQNAIPQDLTSRNPTILPIQGRNSSNQDLNQNAANFKGPKIILPEKFDGRRSKYQEFIIQVQLIIFLHPHRYPTDESRVGLVVTGQALSWFAPLYEKNSPILDSFEVFLTAFKEAFGKPDKSHLATTKIRSKERSYMHQN